MTATITAPGETAPAREWAAGIVIAILQIAEGARSARSCIGVLTPGLAAYLTARAEHSLSPARQLVSVHVQPGIRSAEISAVVRRPDGRCEAIALRARLQGRTWRITTLIM